MRFSTLLHAAWLKPSRWKSWRVFGYKMAGSCLTNVGMCLIASSRYRYANAPSAAPRDFLRSGHIVNLTAANIVLSGTLFEAVLDRVAEKRHAKQKLDLKSAIKTFLRLQTRLDALLDKRNTLARECAFLTAGQKEILEVDGLVLKDMRDLAVAEFRYSFCDIAGLRSARDMATMTTLFGSATAGYGGSLQALLSVDERIPEEAGVAGIGFMTSGSSVIIAPLLVRRGGDMASSRAEKRLQEAGIREPEIEAGRFDEHRKRLESLIAKADPSQTRLLQALNARNSVYNLQNALFDNRAESRAAIKRRERRVLEERLLFSSLVGGAQVARGAQLAVAGFRYPDDLSRAFPLVGSASATYIAGTGVWTLDNVQGKLREELAIKRKAELSVHAKLLEDLDDLQDMENQMSIF